MCWPRKWQCPCPYGPYLLVPLFFTAAAVMCTGYAAFECTFFQISGMSTRRVTVSFGLWTVEKYRSFKSNQLGEPLENVFLYKTPNTCTAWSKHEEIEKSDIDMPIQAARAVVLIAVIFSPFLLGYLYKGRNELFSQLAVRAMSCGMLFTALCTGLSLIALQSSICQDNKEECDIGFAGYICMAAVVFWVIACCTTCTLHGTRGVRRRRKPGESRRERREREREERRLAAERRAMEAEGYDNGYNEDDGEEETAPLADLDGGYDEDEGVFRDEAAYDDDNEGVYRDNDVDERSTHSQYRDDADDYDETVSYHSNSMPEAADDESVNKTRHID